MHASPGSFCRGNLPEGFHFGQKSAEVRAILGEPVLSRRCAPTSPIDLNLSRKKFLQRLSEQKALPDTIRLDWYRLNKHVITVEFDDAVGDSLKSIELSTYGQYPQILRPTRL